MKTTQARIKSPCAADWDAMRTDTANDDNNPTRFCEACQKHVHNLSAMTRRQAERLLADTRARGERLCIRYQATAEGYLRFQPRLFAPKAPIHQQQGAGRLLTAAALVVAAAFSPLESAFATEPSQIEEQLWSQERAAAQQVAPLGLTLDEEEYQTNGLTYQYQTIAPPPPPDIEPMMGDYYE